MKIKLDENLGNLRVATWLRQSGYDVMTVRQQNLTSTPDENLIQVCHLEERCLITADRGFGNRLKYNPANYSGIVIIRLPPRPSFDDWKLAIAESGKLRLIDTLIQGLNNASVKGKLWIVKQDKIEEYLPIDE